MEFLIGFASTNLFKRLMTILIINIYLLSSFALWSRPRIGTRAVGCIKVGDMNCIIMLKNQNIHRKPVIHMELKLVRKLALQR